MRSGNEKTVVAPLLLVLHMKNLFALEMDMKAPLLLLVCCGLTGWGCGSSAPAADLGPAHEQGIDAGRPDLPASLSIALQPARLVLRQGSSVAVAIAVNRTGWSGPVALSANGLPTGVTAPPVATDGDSASLLVAAENQAATGLASATVVASGGGTEVSAALVVDIRRPEAVDSSFGSGGSVRFEIAQKLFPDRLVLQPDGKILVSADVELLQAGDPSPAGNVVYRFLSSGALDTSFGQNGVSVIGSSQQMLSAPIAIQPDGGIVGVYICNPPQLCLRRLQPNGVADASFGAQGLVKTSLEGNESTGDVAVQPDGKIVVVGTTHQTLSAPASLFILRYLPDGQLDSGFANGGKVIHSFADQLISIQRMILEGGAIYIQGRAFKAGAFIARFTGSGALDTGFGDAGMSTGWERIESFRATPTGIVVSGRRSDSSEEQHLAWLTSAGAVDPSVGDGGILAVAAPAQTAFAGLVVEPVGRLILGRGVSEGNGTLELVAFSGKGEPEQSFGGGGALALKLDRQASILAIARADDGRIVVLAQASPSALFLGRFYP